MTASIRFLGFAILAWAGGRAASLIYFPGSTVTAAPAARAAALPPVAQTRFDPPPPPDPVPQQGYYPGFSSGYGPAYPGAYPGTYPAAYPPAYGGFPRGDRTIVIPASWPTNAVPPSHYAGGWAGIMPTPQPLYYVPLSPEPWPSAPAVSTPAMRVRPR